MLNQIPPPTFSNELISMAQRPLTSGHLLRTSFPICKMGCSPPRGRWKDCMGNTHTGLRAQGKLHCCWVLGMVSAVLILGASEVPAVRKTKGTQVKKQVKMTFWLPENLPHSGTKVEAARTPLGWREKKREHPPLAHTVTELGWEGSSLRQLTGLPWPHSPFHVSSLDPTSSSQAQAAYCPLISLQPAASTTTSTHETLPRTYPPGSP